MNMKDNERKASFCVDADSGADFAETAAEATINHGKKSIPQKAAPTVRRAVIPVDTILVEETFGRALDDDCIGMLAAIVERYGPQGLITVTPDFRLLAGHRWLIAVKKLGWAMVEVVIMAATL
jgi:hypothetical protein